MEPSATKAASPARNLKDAIIALAILIASGMVGYIAMDMFNPGESETFMYMLIGLSFFLLVFSVILAVVSLVKVQRDLRTDKHNKNYAALVINVAVLALVAYQVASRLIF
ncbi:MAG TPA: hypothetical protein VD996_02460 [Chitinophagaceae bacterium]|nr:hypothetical protein [Chitinophagaceae bacterium]